MTAATSHSQSHLSPPLRSRGKCDRECDRQKLTQKTKRVTFSKTALDTQPENLNPQNQIMKQLPNNLIHQGHNLELIERIGNVALYRTSREGESTPGFLVAKIREQKPSIRQMPNGEPVVFEHKEILPGENDFGRLAWFFRTLEPARDKFSALRVAANSAPNGKKVSTQRESLTPA